MKKTALILVLSTCLDLLACYSRDMGANDPALSVVYLTWEHQDTSTHMTINYHTQKDYKNSQVFYDTVPRQGDISQYRFSQKGRAVELEPIQRWFHRITLSPLDPGKTYYFVVGDEITGFSREFKFRTLPDDGSPFRFVSGGDMGISEEMRDISYLAAQQSPHFVILGGDIAYANGRIGEYSTWKRWLQIWQETMVTPEGYLIPFATAVGNHDVNGTGESITDRSPFFYTLFAQGLNTESYFLKHFGPDLTIYFLDSGHLHSHSGQQEKWLDRNLERTAHSRYKIAVYHVPLYPSHRGFNDDLSSLGRKHWLPLFDRFDVDIAFENHDHTFKRTFPLRGNQIDEAEGTIYLGDGCWGRSPRSTREERWYLDRAEKRAHIWIVDYAPDRLQLRAMDSQGQVFDQIVFHD